MLCFCAEGGWHCGGQGNGGGGGGGGGGGVVSVVEAVVVQVGVVPAANVMEAHRYGLPPKTTPHSSHDVVQCSAQETRLQNSQAPATQCPVATRQPGVFRALLSGTSDVSGRLLPSWPVGQMVDRVAPIQQVRVAGLTPTNKRPSPPLNGSNICGYTLHIVILFNFN